MPLYILVIIMADGRQHTTVYDFRDDASAIADLGQLISADSPNAAVAHCAGDDLEWLGAWAWANGTPVWTAND
jgi:hypothetical protein